MKLLCRFNRVAELMDALESWATGILACDAYLKLKGGVM